MITLQNSVTQNILDTTNILVQDGEIFALPVVATQLTWQVAYVGSPTSVLVQILISLDGTNFSVLDFTTAVGGESKTRITSAAFIRARIDSISGTVNRVVVSVIGEASKNVITQLAADDVPLHAVNHYSGGIDPLTVTRLLGFPGTTDLFLRGDATFQPISGSGTGPAQLPYVDLVEGVYLKPIADVARVYALDVNGYTQVEMVDSAGHGARLASDNIVIAKITEPTGITRGQAVYIAGASGANSLVNLAKSDNIATMPAIGIVLDAGPANAFTRVLTSGTLQGVNTSAFIEGVSLFVSPTVAGEFTTVLPVAPAYAQRVGFVTRSHLTQGEILVLTTGVSGEPRLHAATHQAGGTDEVLFPSGIKERGRSVAMGEWINVPFNAGDFTSNIGSWVISSAGNVSYAYTLIGKTCSIALEVLNASTISGSPLTLMVKLPSGITIARSVSSGGIMNNNTSQAAVVMARTSLPASLQIVKPTLAAFANTTSFGGLFSSTFSIV